MKVASHGEANGCEVPCLIVAAKDDLDPFTTEIQDSTRVYIDNLLFVLLILNYIILVAHMLLVIMVLVWIVLEIWGLVRFDLMAKYH